MKFTIESRYFLAQHFDEETNHAMMRSDLRLAIERLIRRAELDTVIGPAQYRIVRVPEENVMKACMFCEVTDGSDL